MSPICWNGKVMTINEEQTLSPPHIQISDQVGTDGNHILSMTKITASNPELQKWYQKSHVRFLCNMTRMDDRENYKPSFAKPTFTQLMIWDKYLKENQSNSWNMLKLYSSRPKQFFHGFDSTCALTQLDESTSAL